LWDLRNTKLFLFQHFVKNYFEQKSKKTRIVLSINYLLLNKGDLIMKLYGYICLFVIAALFSGCDESTTNPTTNNNSRMSLLTAHQWYLHAPELGTSDVVKFNSDGTMYFYKGSLTRRNDRWKFIQNETKILTDEDTVEIVTLDESTLVLRGKIDSQSNVEITYKSVFKNPTVNQQLTLSGTLDVKIPELNLDDYMPAVVWHIQKDEVYIGSIGTIVNNNSFNIVLSSPPDSALLVELNKNAGFGFIVLIPKGSYTNNQYIPNGEILETSIKGGVKDIKVLFIKDKNSITIGNSFVSMFDFNNGLNVVKKWKVFDSKVIYMPVKNDAFKLTISNDPNDFIENWN